MFYHGDRGILENKSTKIAIVGSRHMTSYGNRVLEKIIPELIQNNFVIVSGFMYGVDMEAHNLALAFGGKTIAVLGWGIDFEKLPDNPNFLAISEYKGKTKPQLWMFPKRNEVVVKISDSVLVIEAGEKSGSLITAKLAIKHKKKLYAVPGPITSSVSVGTNMLIKEGKAEMITEARDLIRSHPARQGEAFSKIQPSKHPTLQALSHEPLSLDELAIKLKKTPQEVSVELSMLELSGEVKLEGGKYFVK